MQRKSGPSVQFASGVDLLRFKQVSSTEDDYDEQAAFRPRPRKNIRQRNGHRVLSHPFPSSPTHLYHFLKPCNPHQEPYLSPIAGMSANTNTQEPAAAAGDGGPLLGLLQHVAAASFAHICQIIGWFTQTISVVRDKTHPNGYHHQKVVSSPCAWMKQITSGHSRSTNHPSALCFCPKILESTEYNPHLLTGRDVF